MDNDGGEDTMDVTRESLAALAAGLAVRAHAGQIDKAGRPYAEHVQRVASYVDQSDPDAIAAALLHDTLEDTPLIASDLAAAGIPAHVIDAVQLVTRRPNQPSVEYYAQIRGHRLAREVKLADLADNTDPTRLALLPQATQERLHRKYIRAYEALGAESGDGDRRRHQHLTGVPR